jgi:glycine betaine/proline transport system substrate-binding protein
MPLLRTLVALLALGSLTLAAAQESDPRCFGLERPIVFGDLDWDSAQLANWIARLVLERAYGCTTDALPGSVVPIYQGAIRGDVDVITEIWTDNVPDVWTEAVAAGRVVEVGVNFDDAVQGWFVPRFMVEGDAERGIAASAPTLRHVDDLARYAHLFRDPEQPDKGRFYNCVIGWQCELINTVKLHAYGLTDSFTDFQSGTGVALAASMESAFLRGEAWVGYYWGPTWVLGKLDMIMLDEPPYTEACWEYYTGLLETPSAAEYACAYPTSTTVVALGSRFKDDAPERVRAFLERFRTSNALLSEGLAFMQENDAEPRDAAEHFLATREDVWSQWLDDDAAARLRATID